jgi:hypothetical protein
MEIDPPGADLAEHLHRINGRERRADDVAEWVAAAITDRPESEGKLVFRLRVVGVWHKGEWVGRHVAEPTNQNTFRQRLQLSGGRIRVQKSSYISREVEPLPSASCWG